MSKNDLVVRVAAELQPLMPRFLEGRRKDLAALQDALLARDFERVRQIAHGLKGVGGGYGFPALTQWGGELELQARESDAAALSYTLAAMRTYMDNVRVEFEAD